MRQTCQKDKLQEFLPAYLLHIKPGGKAVYLTTIVLVVSIIASLPFVKVNVSVSGTGIIRPEKERSEIIATGTGTVAMVLAREGDNVRKGDPLLRMRSYESELALKALMIEEREVISYLADLDKLCTGAQAKLLTPKYIKESEKYSTHYDYLELVHTRALNELDRHEGLFREGLISRKRYEDLQFNASKTGKELESFRSSSLADWQAEYDYLRGSLRELRERIRNMNENIRLTTVYSPSTGNIVDFDGIYEGSFLRTGSVLGIISPTCRLQGEFYLPSSHMAYLQKGQSVRIHVDAFNTMEWGTLGGIITGISDDFIIVDNTPVYRIKCSLLENELQLRNGYRAVIKKGMSFRAQCIVSERSLFQLLWDRVGDWLNPIRNSPS